MAARGCEVWLYATASGGVVGFGSLGRSNWKWPDAQSPRRPISVIPMFGVRTQFRANHLGPPEQRFATQILRDLIAEAASCTDRDPLLGLYVHQDNQKAIRFYRRNGFLTFHTEHVEGGQRYQGMILKVDQPS